MNSGNRGLGAAALALSLVACALAWLAWQGSPGRRVARAAGGEKPTAPDEGWLTGDAEHRFAQIEKHLRGLDVAMAEIGYRYDELLSAGKMRNFDYARYQTEKIGLALSLAIERRPKREKSGRPFLDETLPEVMRAVETKDGPALDAALDRLRDGCIQCHRAENVLYMGQRLATVHPTAPATARVIGEYKKKLTPDYLRGADRSRGRLVYAKHCANCHVLFGEGTDNGPDLTGLPRSDLDYLLTTIIDPNAVIGHDYLASTVVTKKGKVITGLVKGEGEKTLTVQTTATEKVVIPREEVEERSPSEVSFMPEGILQMLSDEEVRDLIAYLQGPGQVPLPPEEDDRDSEKPGPRAMLIEPAELEKKLKEPGLRILDARPREEYAKGHVPGAVWVDVKGWQAQGKKEGGFRDAEAWGEKVGRLGIGRGDRVVVYGSALPDTARVWWTLEYLGVRDVAILDGGWDHWVKEKRPAEKTSPEVEAVKFEPRFQADRLEEIDSLKRSVRSGAVTVVDARSEDEYAGKEVRGGRGGHIPGARHLEWKELLAEDGRFKRPDELRELFRRRGITPEQTAVTC